MKRKALIAVLCMVMAVSIMNTGCSGNTNKKEERHTTETNNKSNKDTEEKTMISYPIEIDSSSFSRAVGTKKTKNLSFRNTQVQVIKCHQVPISFYQIFYLNNVCGHAFPPSGFPRIVAVS